MGAPGSCGQQTLVLGNAHMSEMAIKGAAPYSGPPSHVCEPNPDGTCCTMINGCALARRWKAEHARGPLR